MTINGTDIIMIRGDTEVLSITCTTDEGEERPFIDGDTVIFTVAWPGQNSSVLQKTINVFSDGAADISIEHDDTNDLPHGEYVYDVQLNTSGGEVKTIIPLSKFVLLEDVTRE